MKHKHAELMLQYAQDAMETKYPWQRWEIKKHGMADWQSLWGWPSFDPQNEYRRKPRTIRIGEYDVPEPIREPLNYGVGYWVASILDSEFRKYAIWEDDEGDYSALTRGLVHSTVEAASIHGKALVSLTQLKP